jgi:DNA topoisomerase-1
LSHRVDLRGFVTHAPGNVRSPMSEELLSDPAAAAGLVYVDDTGPGIERRRCGRGFRYLDEDAEPVRDERVLQRIRRLAIPPAWEHVWICPLPDGHLQATGFDARGRKQYRYHERWRTSRDSAKFERLAEFGGSLPTVREAVHNALQKRDLSRETVVSGVIDLLDRTLIRVGNERYVVENNSYGLTTLRNRHAEVGGQRVTFRFRGKSGVRQHRVVNDRRLASLIRRCQDLPGQVLFQYLDLEDGTVHAVQSSDVNALLHELTGEPYTAKDFRTWGASVRVSERLAGTEPPGTKAETRRTINAAIDDAAAQLGNTRAVCRNSYVHPAVIEGFTTGALQKLQGEAIAAYERAGLPVEEARLLALLHASA